MDVGTSLVNVSARAGVSAGRLGSAYQEITGEFLQLMSASELFREAGR